MISNTLIKLFIENFLTISIKQNHDFYSYIFQRKFKKGKENFIIINKETKPNNRLDIVILDTMINYSLYTEYKGYSIYLRYSFNSDESYYFYEFEHTMDENICFNKIKYILNNNTFTLKSRLDLMEQEVCYTNLRFFKNVWNDLGINVKAKITHPNKNIRGMAKELI